MIDALRSRFRPLSHRLRVHSLSAALREQQLDELDRKLRLIVPDVSDQYSTFRVEPGLVETSVRAMHAFQIDLVEEAIRIVATPPPSAGVTVMDVGDSSGTHLRYLQARHPDIRALSVNVDLEAVTKIQSKGLQAVHGRAEEVAGLGVHPDIVMCFETLEHMTDPVAFLRAVRTIESCRALVITVPHVRRSRVGLQYIRSGQKRKAGPETTHIFELSPGDWRLLFRFTGWRAASDRVFRQYPRRGLFVLTYPMWVAVDYAGFYGAVLVKDGAWSELYG
jgi:2-polyprenyl-3-methyl-5-hydroxy-6-metoxy-1,4-benzoquinol methylase